MIKPPHSAVAEGSPESSSTTAIVCLLLYHMKLLHLHPQFRWEDSSFPTVAELVV